jgi:hypothetical protein
MFINNSLGLRRGELKVRLVVVGATMFAGFVAWGNAGELKVRFVRL